MTYSVYALFKSFEEYFRRQYAGIEIIYLHAVSASVDFERGGFGLARAGRAHN
jgi:hypothetical protein